LVQYKRTGGYAIIILGISLKFIKRGVNYIFLISAVAKPISCYTINKLPGTYMISEKKILLLVEDELLIATVEMKALEKAGFSVITAATGEQAIEKVRSTDDIDLVLMDINLGPGIDGAEAATVILKERDIPLVFLSSHTEPDVVDRTESITSYGYVVKNSGITVLTASIRMAFKLYDARREIEKQSRAVEDANRKLQDLLNELEETNRELVASRSEIIESRSALVESNEKFMRIADSMPQIVWTADCSGRIDFLNDIYYAYAGEDRYNSKTELVNVHPDDVESSSDEWRESVATGKIYEVRQRLRRHDGVYRWFLNRGIPVFNNDNNLIKWYGTCTDIDDLVLLREERLRLEKNLLEAQRLSSTGSF
jgi:PAS domain S-box-containing protein